MTHAARLGQAPVVDPRSLQLPLGEAGENKQKSGDSYERSCSPTTKPRACTDQTVTNRAELDALLRGWVMKARVRGRYGNDFHYQTPVISKEQLAAYNCVAASLGAPKLLGIDVLKVQLQDRSYCRADGSFVSLATRPSDVEPELAIAAFEPEKGRTRYRLVGHPVKEIAEQEFVFGSAARPDLSSTTGVYHPDGRLVEVDARHEPLTGKVVTIPQAILGQVTNGQVTLSVAYDAHADNPHRKHWAFGGWYGSGTWVGSLSNGPISK
jgi:hypothetical protein